MNFPSVNPALARALAAREYLEPTPVQAAVLQAGTDGRDLVVSAQTGSGKTVAYGLAFAPTLLGSEELFPARSGAPLALIIAPTRELAMQVHAELSWLYAETGAKIVSCVGGMDARGERRLLANGCHIVVGTPGRLRDHQGQRRTRAGGEIFIRSQQGRRESKAIGHGLAGAGLGGNNKVPSLGFRL